MKISVILCTYNRCRSLSRALESIAESQLLDGIEWEVLVVDNNSKDSTAQVVHDFCRRFSGRFRYLFEPEQGKSYALNAGIRESAGDVLAFVDDDVLVESTWLCNLTGALRDNQWAGAGGRILPNQAFTPPRWLSLEGPYAMDGVLALFDRGKESGELDWAPYGTNMAFRKAMFEKYGLFRTDLGPEGNTEIRGEDTEFGRRLIAGGERLHYAPSAVVYHEVPEKRLHKQYFLTWWFDFGRAWVREWGRSPESRIPSPYVNILKSCAMQIPGMAIRWMLALSPQRRFFFKTRIWKAAGEITESYRRSRLADNAGQPNGCQSCSTRDNR